MYDWVCTGLIIFLIYPSLNFKMLDFPLYKTATGQRTYYLRTVKLWNSVDLALKLKTTLKDFKRCLMNK